METSVIKNTEFGKKNSLKQVQCTFAFAINENYVVHSNFEANYHKIVPHIFLEYKQTHLSLKTHRINLKNGTFTAC